jgi:hypothetical protein
MLNQSYIDFIDLRQTRPPAPPGTLIGSDEHRSLQQSEEVTKSPKKERVKRSTNKIHLSSVDGSPSDENAQNSSDADGTFFIDHSDKAQLRLRAMLVNFCHITDLRFFRNIDLEQFGIDSGQTVKNATVQELCALMDDKIDELIMSNCIDITDVG